MKSVSAIVGTISCLLLTVSASNVHSSDSCGEFIRTLGLKPEDSSSTEYDPNDAMPPYSDVTVKDAIEKERQRVLDFKKLIMEMGLSTYQKDEIRELANEKLGFQAAYYFMCSLESPPTTRFLETTLEPHDWILGMNDIEKLEITNQGNVSSRFGSSAAEHKTDDTVKTASEVLIPKYKAPEPAGRRKIGK